MIVPFTLVEERKALTNVSRKNINKTNKQLLWLTYLWRADWKVRFSSESDTHSLIAYQ